MTQEINFVEIAYIKVHILVDTFRISMLLQ